MNAQQIHNFLTSGQPTELNTLGGNSSFQFFYLNGVLNIISSQNILYIVPDNVFATVYVRYFVLGVNERWHAQNYVNPNWDNCPNRNLSPWVARIIKYFDTGK